MQYPSAWLQGASLGEKVASELRLQMIDGRIKAGTVLSENQIAADFAISRSPVREALKTLSNEGLIRLERMGAVVLGLTSKDIEEIYDVRCLIETFILKRLATDSHEDLVNTLNIIIDKMEMAAKHGDYIEFSYHDLYFHEVMIIEANHTRIQHLWNNFRNVVLTALLVATAKRFKEDIQSVDKLIEKHRLILKALISKNTELIEKVIQEHFEDTRKTVSSTLNF